MKVRGYFYDKYIKMPNGNGICIWDTMSELKQRPLPVLPPLCKPVGSRRGLIICREL